MLLSSCLPCIMYLTGFCSQQPVRLLLDQDDMRSPAGARRPAPRPLCRRLPLRSEHDEPAHYPLRGSPSRQWGLVSQQEADDAGVFITMLLRVLLPLFLCSFLYIPDLFLAVASLAGSSAPSTDSLPPPRQNLHTQHAPAPLEMTSGIKLGHSPLLFSSRALPLPLLGSRCSETPAWRMGRHVDMAWDGETDERAS